MEDFRKDCERREAEIDVEDGMRRQLNAVAASAVGLENAQQGIVRLASVKLLSVTSELAKEVEEELRQNTLTIRQLRKDAVPILNCLAALSRQAARFAQFDRDFDSKGD